MASLVGTQIIGKIVPVDSGDTYPTHDDFYGKGGYSIITAGFNALTAATTNAIPEARQKVGQIVYDRVNDRHYQIRTVGRNLSAAYGMRGAWPHEFEGSFRSTNIKAKNGNNVIASYIGLSLGSNVFVTNEAFEYSGILAGKDNRIFMDDYQQSYIPTQYGSLIVGGSANQILPGGGLGAYSFIGGGSNNTVGRSWGSLVGGRYNRNNGYAAFIGGGENNDIGGTSYAGGDYGVIVGGKSHVNTGLYNFIGGGTTNQVKGENNAIVGGAENQALGIGDIIVGGQNNKTFEVSGPGNLLFTKNYGNIKVRYEYALQTSFGKVGNFFVEAIPGAEAGGVEAAGLINIYRYNSTYNDYLTGRTILQTISSESPTVSGLFGGQIFRAYSRTNFTGLLVGEPGANKIHVYIMDVDFNTGPAITKVQTINLSDYEISPPSTSNFGYSISYDNYYYNGSRVQGSPYAFLAIGAPGIDSVYTFTCNKLDPFSSVGSYVPFTLVEKIQGQAGSEFGSEISLRGYWTDTTANEFLSAVSILVSAPNETTPSGKNSGAIRVFLAEVDAGYTVTNRVYKPIKYWGIDLFNNHSNKNNDRFGTYVLNHNFGPKEPGRFPIEVSAQANSNLLSLTSYAITYYVSIPNASFVAFYLPDPSVPGKVINFGKSFDLGFTYPDTSYITVTALSAGMEYGRTAYLSGFNENGSLNFDDYGGFFVLGYCCTSTNFVGAGGSTSGIYSITSALTSTQYSWTAPYQKFGYDYPPSGLQYSYRILSKTPRNFNGVTNTFHPGYAVTYTAAGENGFTQIAAPYPTTNYNQIENYGFINFRIAGTETSSGLATFYYLSAGMLCYANFTTDAPGEVQSNSVIVGGKFNQIRGKNSAVISGQSNQVGLSIARSTILAGNNNLIDDITNSGIAKLNSLITNGQTNRIRGVDYGVIINGSNNTINGFSNYSSILNGLSNTINQNTTYSTIVNGRNNTINQNLSGVFIVGSNITATQSNTTYVNNLIASNHIQAATKSFSIKHPSKKGKRLIYGSLESPYHGVRLTGFDKTYDGICTVQLPDYINSLVKEEDINIQLTNYKHGNTLYVDNIDLSKNQFTVRASGLLSRVFTYEFYWSFTAVRKDVPEIQVEA